MAEFVLLKVPLWCMEPKKPFLPVDESPDECMLRLQPAMEALLVQPSANLNGKFFNQGTLLDFSNGIRPDGSDPETSRPFLSRLRFLHFGFNHRHLA